MGWKSISFYYYFRICQVTKKIFDDYSISVSSETMSDFVSKEKVKVGHRHMNVILDSLSHKNFNLLKNYSSSCNPIIINHERIEDFSEFPLQLDSVFYVLKKSTNTIYSLYKISPQSKDLQIEIGPIEEFAQSLK